MLLKRKFMRGHPLINNSWLKQERKPQGTVGNPPNYKNTTVGCCFFKDLQYWQLGILNFVCFLEVINNLVRYLDIRYGPSVWGGHYIAACFQPPQKAQNNFFFAEFALRECLVRNTEVNTFVLGHQHGQMHGRHLKTNNNKLECLRIQQWVISSI